MLVVRGISQLGWTQTQVEWKQEENRKVMEYY